MIFTAFRRLKRLTNVCRKSVEQQKMFDFEVLTLVRPQSSWIPYSADDKTMYVNDAFEIAIEQ